MNCWLFFLFFLRHMNCLQSLFRNRTLLFHHDSNKGFKQSQYPKERLSKHRTCSMTIQKIVFLAEAVKRNINLENNFKKLFLARVGRSLQLYWDQNIFRVFRICHNSFKNDVVFLHY